MNKNKHNIKFVFNNKLFIYVILSLITGLTLGYFFPNHNLIKTLYISGTYFPKTIVTFAALIIFLLMGGAVSKLILTHRERAGRFFKIVFMLYVLMGFISLVYVVMWVPLLTDIPFRITGNKFIGPIGILAQIGHTLLTILTEQPLLQVLIGSLLAGYLSANFKSLRPIADGLIWSSNLILKIFKKLLWYYPIMIGSLAIGIPLKFGSKGLVMYGQTVMWIALVTIIWSVIMIVFVRISTQRSWQQILAYYLTVWPTGFGTGGSYDALAINLTSANNDLGLDKEVADVSIVFGTVLNKNCSTMGVLLVTITVCTMLKIPISIMELIVLIPPVMIMGLESPGIPGGAAFFMSPVIAGLLNVPDANLFVTTFVTVYSGLIPMLATAGNTTDDGMIGAILQDKFLHTLIKS